MDGMIHTQGESEISPPDSLRVFSARSAKGGAMLQG